jgi:hypothetical protein
MDPSKALVVEDGWHIPIDKLVVPSHAKPYIGGILVSKGLIKDRVEQLA